MIIRSAYVHMHVTAVHSVLYNAIAAVLRYCLVTGSWAARTVTANSGNCTPGYVTHYELQKLRTAWL